MKVPTKKFFIYAFVIFIIAMLFFSIFSNKQVVVEGYNNYQLRQSLDKALSIYDSSYQKLTNNIDSYSRRSTPDLYNSNVSQLMQNSKFKNLQNACKPFNSSDCNSTGICSLNQSNICDVKIPPYVGRI